MTGTDAPSGADLMAELYAAAQALGVPPRAIVPASRLEQIAAARRPRPDTVASIRRQIAVAQGLAMRSPDHARGDAPPTASRPAEAIPRAAQHRFAVQDRDPCPRCGVRRDIGCAHIPAEPVRLIYLRAPVTRGDDDAVPMLPEDKRRARASGHGRWSL